MVRINYLLFIPPTIFVASVIYASEYETEVRSYKALSDNPSGFVEVVELEDNSYPVDIADELNNVSAVQVNRTGGIDSFSTVMIRGASSNSIDIYINGIKLNQSYSGSYNLSLLPDELFERIEIYKGFTPTRLGFSNTGGAINLVTRKGRGGEKGIKLTYGSFNTLQFSYFDSEFQNGSGYNLTLYARHTDGDYEFLNRNGTYQNKEDDVIKRRENNYKNEYALLITAASKVLRDYKLNISLLPSFSEGGLPGIENIETKKAHYNSLYNIASLENVIRTHSFVSGLVLGFSNIYYRSEYNDEKGELYMMLPEIVDMCSIKNNFYLSSDILLPLNTLKFKVNSLSEDIRRGSRIHKNESYEGTRREVSINVEDDLRLVYEGLHLITAAGIKWIGSEVDYTSQYLMKSDRLKENSDIRDLRAGLYYRVTAELLLKLNLSFHNRYPDMYELFGDGLYIYPSPHLKPEKGRLFDSGFDFYTDLISIRFALFFNRYEDLIQFFQNSQKTIKAENVSKAEIYGTELSLTPYLRKDVISEIRYTHQEPINKSDIPAFKDKILPFRYRDNLYLRFGFDISGVRLIYEYDYSSQNYFDAANLLPEGGPVGRSIHNLSLQYAFEKMGLKAGLYIKNITDVRTEDIAGYPLPGRMFFIGIGKTFFDKKEVEYEKG